MVCFMGPVFPKSFLQPIQVGSHAVPRPCRGDGLPCHHLHTLRSRLDDNESTPRLKRGQESSPSLNSPENMTANGTNKVGFVGAEKLGISFTCTVGGCGTRISKMIRRKSYEKGTVLIQCPSCKTRHLISDHLGWYKEITGGVQSIEQIANEKGQDVVRVNSDVFQLEKLIAADAEEVNIESSSDEDVKKNTRRKNK